MEKTLKDEKARLRAAAPELLEACKLLADWTRRHSPADDWPREYTLAIRAIAKAEGGWNPDLAE